MEDLIKRILERIMTEKSDITDEWYKSGSESLRGADYGLSLAESIIMDEYNKAKED